VIAVATRAEVIFVLCWDKLSSNLRHLTNKWNCHSQLGIRSAARQNNYQIRRVAQLSQRDRDAGWVSYGQNW